MWWVRNRPEDEKLSEIEDERGKGQIESWRPCDQKENKRKGKCFILKVDFVSRFCKLICRIMTPWNRPTIPKLQCLSRDYDSRMDSLTKWTFKVLVISMR